VDLDFEIGVFPPDEHDRWRPLRLSEYLRLSQRGQIDWLPDAEESVIFAALDTLRLEDEGSFGDLRYLIYQIRGVLNRLTSGQEGLIHATVDQPAGLNLWFESAREQIIATSFLSPEMGYAETYAVHPKRGFESRETYDYVRQHSAQLREHAIGQITASRTAWIVRLREALRSGEQVLRAYER